MIGNRLRIITRPDSYPVEVDEYKREFSIAGDKDDFLLKSLIIAATEEAQNYTNRYFLNHTLEATVDGFNLGTQQYVFTIEDLFPVESDKNYIELPVMPVSSITNVKIYDQDNNETTYSSANYFLDEANGRVVFNDDATFGITLRQHAPIKITFVSGYGDKPDDVPEDIRMAIKFDMQNKLNAMKATNRTNRTIPQLNEGAKAMLQRHRLYQVY